MKHMSDEAKVARREYLRQWRMNNPEKVAAHIATYWERKAAQAKEQEVNNNGSKKY